MAAGTLVQIKTFAPAGINYVQLSINGQKAGQSNAAPFSIPIPATLGGAQLTGSATLRVDIFDGNGNNGHTIDLTVNIGSGSGTTDGGTGTGDGGTRNTAGGCAVTPSNQPWLLSLAALLMLGVGRRRRRRTAG